MEDPPTLSIYMKDPSKIRGVSDKMYPWNFGGPETRNRKAMKLNLYPSGYYNLTSKSYKYLEKYYENANSPHSRSQEKANANYNFKCNGKYTSF